MKTRITLLLLLFTLIAHAQYNDDYYYYDNEPQFGLGVGYNLTSLLGDEVKPLEFSFRFKINHKNQLQVYLPLLRSSNSFHSKNHHAMELIKTSVDTKKRVYGVGIDYDYAVQSYQSLQFLLGLRGEFNLYKYRTELTNTAPAATSNHKNREYTYRETEMTNYLLSPTAGLRLNLNKFTLDAKLLLSMRFRNGDEENRVETQRGVTQSPYIQTEEWTNSVSSSFKLKPAVVVSMAYYF